jgi:hypothetical protein
MRSKSLRNAEKIRPTPGMKKCCKKFLDGTCDSERNYHWNERACVYNGPAPNYDMFGADERCCV